MNETKIFIVDGANIVILKSHPPKLNITAYGRATTPGWRMPELIGYVYVQPPADGIWDFDFVAAPPTGIEPQVLSHIHVNHFWENPPYGLRGVRIHGVSGSKEALLGQSGGQPGKIAIKGTLTDEGIECQAMRAETGELYTLVGDLKGFKIADKVYVAGTITQISFCMQGLTISIDWINKEAPKIAS